MCFFSLNSELNLEKFQILQGNPWMALEYKGVIKILIYIIIEADIERKLSKKLQKIKLVKQMHE